MDYLGNKRVGSNIKSFNRKVNINHDQDEDFQTVLNDDNNNLRERVKEKLEKINKTQELKEESQIQFNQAITIKKEEDINEVINKDSKNETETDNKNIEVNLIDYIEKQRQLQEYSSSGNSSDISDMFNIIDKKVNHSDVNILKLPVNDGIEDNEGYYLPRQNEIITNISSKYQITNIIGKGVFSCVVEANLIINDIITNETKAIKILKNNEFMRLSGEKESLILNKLKKVDPKGINQIIRLDESFTYKNHLCLVFEKLDTSLRDLLKLNYNKGLPLNIIKSYTRQILYSLSFIHSNKIIHTDCKYLYLTYISKTR